MWARKRYAARDTTYGYEADNDLDVLTHAGIVSFDHGYNAVHQLTSKAVSAAAYRWVPTYSGGNGNLTNTHFHRN